MHCDLGGGGGGFLGLLEAWSQYEVRQRDFAFSRNELSVFGVTGEPT